MQTFLTDESGFSLVESMVAAVVLILGVGAILYGLVGAGQGSQTGQRQDIAAAIATQELERLRSLPYVSLALNASPTTLPDGRLVGGQFQALTGHPAEDLVIPGSGSTIAPTGTGSVGGQGYTVYRVISWGDQSCPLAQGVVTALSNAVAGLYNANASVEGSLNVLNAVSGTASLNVAISDVANLLNQLLGGLLSSAYTNLSSALSAASTLTRTSGTGLQNLLANINSDLTGLGSSGLIDSSGHLTITSLDLCHLPRLSSLIALPSLTNLTNLTAGLTGSGGVQASLTDLQSQAQASAGFGLLTPSGTVNNTTASVQADNGNISAAVSSSGSLGAAKLGAVHSALANLKTILDCVKNVGGCLNTGNHVDKRISVAVVLDATRAGIGVTKAVWMSSLMTDPQDGLL
jgi:type II secretory pathway pseudopilin PulG